MNKPKTMKDLPDQDQPFEKYASFGVRALSDAELLAILLRSGCVGKNALDVAKEVLSDEGCGGLAGLSSLDESEFQAFSGIGKVKAVQLVCLGEITRRISVAKRSRGPHIGSPEDIAALFMEEMRHLEREELFVLMLNGRNDVIGHRCISRGTVNSSLVSPREVFLEALKMRAVSIALIHNHPSGDPSPSQEDIDITERVMKAGILLGIGLLDHVIIGDNVFLSFRKQEIVL